MPPLGISATPHRATVVIPLHQHADYVGTLIESLAAQWRPDLALLLVDDASTDASFPTAMAALARHPHIPATVLRNATPLHHGILNQVLAFSTTPIVIKCDSDDIALPGRLDATLDAFAADPDCRLVTSNAVTLTAEGVVSGLYDVEEPDFTQTSPVRWSSQVGSAQWLGATAAFHRAVLTAFPPIDPDLCPYGLDLVLPLRATLIGTHRYLARPLVGWRQHARNTHRLAGVADPRLAVRDRYESLELMALRQKIRDAGHALDEGRIGAARAVVACRETFFARFDQWCRIRNQLALAGADAVAAPAPLHRVPPVPPILTLGPGRHGFGLADPLGAAAPAWNGFHGAEDQGTWTSAAALVVLRTTPGLSTLTLRADVAPPLAPQRAFVSVDFGPRVAMVADGTGPAEATLPLPPRPDGTPVALLIEVPGARSLREVIPEASDSRQLGLMLLDLLLA